MRQRPRFRPNLESLESRWVPANMRLTSGILQISNQVGDLTITALSSNSFQVADTVNVATFKGVNFIIATGTNKGNNIIVDLGGNTYSGSLLINSLNGNDVIDIFGDGGSIRGNVTLLTGLGNDLVYINRPIFGGTSSDFTIGGQLTVVDKANGSDAAFFGSETGLLDIRGNVQLIAINTVRIDSTYINPNDGITSHRFRGNFTANLGTDSGAAVDPAASTLPTLIVTDLLVGLDFQEEAAAGGEYTGGTVLIGKTLTLTGNNRDDVVFVGSMEIGGNMFVNFRNAFSPQGNNTVVSDQFSGTTFIKGNFYYNGGSGVDTIDFSNVVIDGNTFAFLGSGADEVALDILYSPAVPVGTFPAIATTFQGDVTISAQSVDTTNINGAPTAGIQAYIGGNLTFLLGNGNSIITLSDGVDDFAAPNGDDQNGAGLGATIGGQLIIRAGNGDNQVNFLVGPIPPSAPSPRLFDLYMTFGNGDNTVTLNNPDYTLNGLISGGTGNNVFDQVAGDIGDWPYFQLINFTGP